jgi:hypothetical protein
MTQAPHDSMCITASSAILPATVLPATVLFTTTLLVFVCALVGLHTTGCSGAQSQDASEEHRGADRANDDVRGSGRMCPATHTLVRSGAGRRRCVPRQVKASDSHLHRTAATCPPGAQPVRDPRSSTGWRCVVTTKEKRPQCRHDQRLVRRLDGGFRCAQTTGSVKRAGQ